MPGGEIWQPGEVREVYDAGECVFEVALRRETLVVAFDQYDVARRALASRQFVDSARALRTALEIAFKSKAGVDKTHKVSFFNLVKGFKAQSVLALQGTYKAAEEAYDFLSRTMAHGTEPLREVEVAGLMTTVGRVLRGIELAEVGKDRIEAIRMSLDIKE